MEFKYLATEKFEYSNNILTLCSNYKMVQIVSKIIQTGLSCLKHMGSQMHWNFYMNYVTSLQYLDYSNYSPQKSEGVCLYRRWFVCVCVCLSVCDHDN